MSAPKISAAALRLDIDTNLSELFEEIQKKVFFPRMDKARVDAPGRLSSERVAQIVALRALYLVAVRDDGVAASPEVQRLIERKADQVAERIKAMQRRKANSGVIPDLSS